MPDPADDFFERDEFFERWAADLPTGERGNFFPDGVVDPAGWAAAPLRVLFVAAEPHALGDRPGEAAVREAGDLRVWWRTRGGYGAFGVPMARWAAMLLHGATPAGAAALDFAERARTVRRIAQINMKKTGGRSTPRPGSVRRWAEAHRDRLRAQVAAIDPRAVVLCGGHARAAWAAVFGSGPTRVGESIRQGGRLVLAAPHPSSRLATPEKDAAVAAFAASPEVAALRRAGSG